MTYWDITPRGAWGPNILGSPHFDEGHRGYISLKIASRYKLKKNSSSIFHGHEACIFDPTSGRKLGNNQKVYVRQFSGSKVSCMKDYVTPSIRENNLDHIIFQVGTNDVSSEKTPQVIAQSTVDLAKNVTNDNLKVTFFSIAP